MSKMIKVIQKNQDRGYKIMSHSVYDIMFSFLSCRKTGKMAIGSKLNCFLALTFLMAYCCLESAAMDGCKFNQWRCGDVCM